MRKLLVSLVSEQTIPNVLFIKEKGSKRDCYLFITTEAMEAAGKTENIVKGAGIEEACIRKIRVFEDCMRDIQAKLDEFMSETGPFDEIIVNITGGTKIMSLAVYDYFNKKKNTWIFYIPLGKNQYKQLFPPTADPDRELKYRLNLNEYLQSCGITVIDQKSCLKSKALAERMLKMYLSRKFESSLRNKLRGEVQVKDKDWLVKILKAVKWEGRKEDFLTSREVQYLKGSWFEEFIYYVFSEKLGKNDSIGLGMRLKKGEVENEFDVIFVHENNLYIFEAKTGLVDKNEINDALYKLGALKKNFGLSARVYLATLSDSFSLSQRERASVLGIRVWTREVFSDPHSLNKSLEECLLS